MPVRIPFRRVSILGTGLIGGSFGLALRKQFPEIEVIGWDEDAVAARATKAGAVSRCVRELAEAVHEADLVYLALPIGTILDVLPKVAESASPKALVTDTGSTKKTICEAAERVFRHEARFLGGHPIAGKELGGIENADGTLVRGARYALIGEAKDADPRLQGFAELLRGLGASPVWLDAKSHDRAVALVSHLPQIAALGLAAVVHDSEVDPMIKALLSESEADYPPGAGLPLLLAGAGLRDTLRLAGSPYAVWRDICLTNRENISAAIDRLMQVLDELRSNLSSRELESDFQAANELYKTLHKVQ